MIEVILFALVLVFAIALAFMLKRNSELEESLEKARFSKQSQSSKYGKIAEQWIPLAKDFPLDSGNFRFLGSPIDGVAFEEDRIVFCEFKAASSGLSQKQKQIKELVKKGKVDWMEYRIS